MTSSPTPETNLSIGSLTKLKTTHIAVLCYAVLCCAVLCCAVLCCAVLCCAILCCAVLCCAVLFCAVLCCAVLCYSVLCYALQRELAAVEGSGGRAGRGGPLLPELWEEACELPELAADDVRQVRHNLGCAGTGVRGRLGYLDLAGTV